MNKIILKTQLGIYFNENEDENKAQILADMVDHKIQTNPKYWNKIEEIVRDASNECLRELPRDFGKKILQNKLSTG